jgi:abortive infection bacteriophage resistance protein
MTIDKINSVYLNESDQYLQVFSEFCRFDNIDKEYLIIKGKNKDNIDKLFIIDATSRIELESMIGEY